MSGGAVLLLALAGVGGGLTGSVAGLASLVSYPALLAAGLPPVAANVTNTVAIVASSVGSAAGSAPELRGQGRRLRRLATASAAGGVVGAGLLLLTPPATFTRLVPWLIGAGSVAILLRPTPDALARRHAAGDAPALPCGVFLVAVYGGYFGAAAGVLMLALLLAATSEPLARGNATKNVVMGVVNGVAALAFAIAAPVSWSAALPLAAGFLVGGRLGPVTVRHLPAGALRVAIAAGGLALAVRLARS